MSDQELLDGRLLVLAPTGRDARLTCRLLEQAGMQAQACEDVDALCLEIERGAAGVLLAQEALVTPALARLVAVLGAQPSWSDLPIVVFTGETPDLRRPHLSMLAQLGNLTFLDRPVRPVTMTAAARAALRARQRQYEARRALEEQEKALQQRDQFLAMLGHELRTPLAVILLAGELLERGGDPAHHRAVIMRQARHLSYLVNDLLDVARVTTGKVVLHREPIELNDLIARCAQSMAVAVSAQALSLNVTASSSEVQVDADPVRLEQVLVNLLSNAVKYTPRGGNIEIRLAKENGQAVLRIRDDGIGIARDMLPRIFDLFAQAETTIDRSQGGLGIGLTLVRSLVALHGGVVTAKSDGLGAGTEVTVRLPLLREAVAPSGASSPAPAAVTGARRVLIVEDNRDARELLRLLVESFGHSVEVAADGAEGLARADTTHPDVMIVDLGLPKVDGFTVAARARASLGNDVTIIALTGYGQPEDRRRALEAGFDCHLIKPVEPARLQRLIAVGRDRLSRTG